MLTIESAVFVGGITGREITDFLLNPSDERYRRWWPGTHLQFHTVARGTEHVGDVVVMDEYIGTRRVRTTGVVVQAVPGKRVVWRLKLGICLPVWLALELIDRDGGVAVRHSIRAGYRGVGRMLDPLFRLFFSRKFAAAMDQHVRIEFPLLRDRLVAPLTGASRSRPGLQSERNTDMPEAPGGRRVGCGPEGTDRVSHRQVERALRFARPLLLEELGEAATVAVERRVREGYVALASGVPRLRAPMSRMTLRIAVDSLVLYRSLPANLARDAKLALVSRFVASWMEGQFESPVARWVYAHRIPHLLLRRWWFWTANVLDEPQGWRFRFAKGGPGLFYAVDVTRCGAVRFLTDQGAPELAPLLCKGDEQIGRYLPPGVTFARSQVISEGAPHCDFRYVLSR